MSRWNRPAGARPFLMGVLNVTPDSFSDGGMFLNTGDAVRHAFELVGAGADIIDVGGESTRPGSCPVTAKTELERIIPVIRDVAPSLSIPLSVDTCKPEVAEAALDAGAETINDVCGLTDARMMSLVSSSGAEVVIMHMHGSPRTLASDIMADPALPEIKRFFDRQTSAAIEAGVKPNKIIIDPGVGFGKTHEQNMQIIRNPRCFSDGFPVLIGPSRKRFLAHGFPGMGRDEATVEAAMISWESGADVIRLHDVSRVRSASE
ncbi:MAG: dihydropteroate synthase [Candidatus Methanoplasma sp.]|nr:dihydropteroate synthase [Candidatus Methanoplasma sp.]